MGDEDRVEAVPPVVGVGHLGSHINFNTQYLLNSEQTHRILKVNSRVSNPGEPTGSDGTEPNDI